MRGRSKGLLVWGLCAIFSVVLVTFSLLVTGARAQNVSYDGLQFKLASVLMLDSTAPAFSSGFGTSPAFTPVNGTAAFVVNVGGGGVATAGVIQMPTARNGWICTVNNLTAAAAHAAFNTRQTATTTTTVSIENQTTSTGAAVAWGANNILHLACSGF